MLEGLATTVTAIGFAFVSVLQDSRSEGRASEEVESDQEATERRRIVSRSILTTHPA